MEQPIPWEFVPQWRLGCMFCWLSTQVLTWLEPKTTYSIRVKGICYILITNISKISQTHLVKRPQATRAGMWHWNQECICFPDCSPNTIDGYSSMTIGEILLWLNIWMSWMRVSKWNHHFGCHGVQTDWFCLPLICDQLHHWNPWDCIPYNRGKTDSTSKVLMGEFRTDNIWYSEKGSLPV